ncbi:uncharacterized protein RHIMIDRAFT_237260 [Rhizopus microsporus ATCC 52813]|uniref:CUE domain-containing protein n=1 Tax=Rhizopus microsporus ATCC 52813 TaxID=1340429 RepID=A0A2G4SY03_RHIZD|nr:uncharacterized protein RHIMIDRAFT_237260 [Rhizopus microsporus ATCC 52813]PHZ13246.1 hypothetical protein RHIMIDRAFT_237260 [Rhizopus microsporus ATCC 52813]
MESNGFRNTPVTKLLVPIVGGCSSLVIAYNSRPNLQLPVNSQFLKIFASQWMFPSIGTTVVGTWLIYRMKIIEQRYGSSKYAALIFISFIASTLLHTGAWMTGYPKYDASNGPFVIICSVLYQFYKIVPASYQTRMMGVMITDKTYVYLAAAQLALSNYFPSFLSCFCGLLIGSIYDNTAIKKWRFPTAIRYFTTKYLLPLLGTHKQKSRTENRSSHRTGQMQVKEEDVQTMLAMFPDYTKLEVERALRTAKSDLNRAADILLTQTSTASSSSAAN